MQRPQSYSFPIGYWLLWIVTLLLSALAAVLFILFIVKQNDIRCFGGNGVSTQPLPTPDGGVHSGRLVYHSQSGEMRIMWSGTTPSRISVRGPIYPPNSLPTAPSAWTICGGNSTLTCSELEAGTCLLRSQPANCGLIETVQRHIDALDTEIGAAHFFNITGFLHKAKEFPELFYISIEREGNEVQRGQFGSTCSSDVL